MTSFAHLLASILSSRFPLCDDPHDLWSIALMDPHKINRGFEGWISFLKWFDIVPKMDIGLEYRKEKQNVEP